jgi:hypothetical protein
MRKSDEESRLWTPPPLVPTVFGRRLGMVVKFLGILSTDLETPSASATVTGRSGVQTLDSASRPAAAPTTALIWRGQLRSPQAAPNKINNAGTQEGSGLAHEGTQFQDSTSGSISSACASQFPNEVDRTISFTHQERCADLRIAFRLPFPRTFREFDGTRCIVEHHPEAPRLRRNTNKIPPNPFASVAILNHEHMAAQEPSGPLQTQLPSRFKPGPRRPSFAPAFDSHHSHCRARAGKGEDLDLP